MLLDIAALLDMFDTLDEEELARLPPVERNLRILDHIYPQLLANMTMLVGKPFRLNWDPMIETAGTDCVAAVNMNPRPFLTGHIQAGRGIGYHEGGHIRWTDNGVELLSLAEEQGGSVQQEILNIMIDRKDDLKTADHAPGFASDLRHRLLYICTLARREKLAPVLNAYLAREETTSVVERKITERDPRRSPKAPQSVDDAHMQLLRNWKPPTAYEDFFFAAKWHKRPHHAVVKKIMRWLRPRRLLAMSDDELLEKSQLIHELLDEAERDKVPTKEQAAKAQAAARAFGQLLAIVAKIATGRGGEKLDPRILKHLVKLTQQYLAGGRTATLQKLVSRLRQMSVGQVWPRPLSTGLTNVVPIRHVVAHPQFGPRYEAMRAEIEHLIQPLVLRLRQLDNPAEYYLYQQDEGELDLSAAFRIACDLGRYYFDTIEERNIDAWFGLCLDTSGSMGGDKVERAKRLAVLFSEAILALAPAAVGNIWSYDSTGIVSYGQVSRESGFTTIEADEGNADSHMLLEVGRVAMESPRRHKVVIMLCDDGPDSIADVRQITQQLLENGVIVIHLFIGVHATPDIYPFEVLFTDFEECINEFGDLLVEIVRNLK